MKNKRIQLLMAILSFCAGVTQAQLADGDFSSGVITKYAANINIEADTYKWVSANTVDTPAYTNQAGVMARIPTAAATSARGFGQLFGDNLPAGNYTLQFDYSFSAGTAAAPIIRATVFFFNDPDGSGDLTANDAMRLGNETVDFVELTFDITILADDHLAEGSYTGYQVAFILPENMVHLDDLGGGQESDWLGIRFLTDDLAGDGSSGFTVDNVTVLSAETGHSLKLMIIQ